MCCCYKIKLKWCLAVKKISLVFNDFSEFEFFCKIKKILIWKNSNNFWPFFIKFEFWPSVYWFFTFSSIFWRSTAILITYNNNNNDTNMNFKFIQRHVQRGATWKNSRHFCLGRQATSEELPPCYTGISHNSLLVPSMYKKNI